MKKKTPRESSFQRKLVAELSNLFPGALIYKNEGIQGFPDLTVLWNRHWALLECKREEDSSKRTNQPYYIERANQMSFGRFVYPENKQEVIHELQQAWGVGRETCDLESE